MGSPDRGGGGGNSRSRRVVCTEGQGGGRVAGGSRVLPRAREHCGGSGGTGRGAGAARVGSGAGGAVGSVQAAKMM